MNFPEVKLPPRARCRMFQKSPHSPSQSPALPRGTTFLIPKNPFTVFEHSALHGSPARTHWLLPKETEAMKRWAGLRLRWALAKVALVWLAAEGGLGAPVGRKVGAVMPEWTQAKALHPSCRTTSRPPEGKPLDCGRSMLDDDPSRPWWTHC